MKCKEKVAYHNREMADAARLDIIASNKRDPRNKQLVVYNCRDCGLLHVGHVRRRLANQPARAKAAPAVKPPTPGQLRRKAAKEAEQTERNAFYADYHQTLQFCKMLVDRELSRYETIGIEPCATVEIK